MDIERCLKTSVARYIKGLFPDVLVVCDEDYPALTSELADKDTFIAYIVGGGSVLPKVARGVGISVYVKNDPGSIQLNTLVSRLAEIKPMSSLPLYDGEEIVTQLVVTEPNLNGIVFSIDQFRTKGVEFQLRGVIP